VDVFAKDLLAVACTMSEWRSARRRTKANRRVCLAWFQFTAPIVHRSRPLRIRMRLPDVEPSLANIHADDMHGLVA